MHSHARIKTHAAGMVSVCGRGDVRNANLARPRKTCTAHERWLLRRRRSLWHATRKLLIGFNQRANRLTVEAKIRRYLLLGALLAVGGVTATSPIRDSFAANEC